MVRVEQYDSLEQGLGSVLLDVEQRFKNADYTKLFKKWIDTVLPEAHAGYFSNRSSPGGEKWAPLKPLTVAKKGHSTILEDTLAMKNSVTGKTGDSVRSATHRGLLFGTSDHKAIFHTTGTARMAKREFVGMDEKRVDALCNEVADATVEQLKL